MQKSHLLSFLILNYSILETFSTNKSYKIIKTKLKTCTRQGRVKKMKVMETIKYDLFALARQFEQPIHYFAVST